MTRIDFYHGATDRLETAVRLCAKAWAHGEPATLFTRKSELADRLDRLMWTRDPNSFLPHCRSNAPLAGETPILICDQLEPIHQDRLLINVDDDPPPGFERFLRLLDITDTQESTRQAARQRLRFYRERGYEVTLHDLSERA